MIKQPNTIPTSPGVYFFRDATKKPIYIGKAANLRNRLRSYFGSHTKDPRVSIMLESARSVTWEELGSEIEALIRESELIKKFRPKYNIALRDDKQYIYVAITKETYPKIFTTHQPAQFSRRETSSGRPTDHAQILGPFTDATALKATLQYLRKIFPYCTCRKPHTRYCLNYHIGKCLGDCCLKDATKQKSAYAKNIRAIKAILQGKRKNVRTALEREMKAAAKKGNLESALALRQQYDRLERVFENAHVLREIAGRDNAMMELQKIFKLPAIPRRIEGYDISNIHGQNAVGSMVVFTNGQPDKNEYRKFKIRTKSTPDDYAMLTEVLERRFKHHDWAQPDLLLIDGGKGQINAAILASPKEGVPTISIAKGKQEIFSTTLPEPIALANLPEEVKNLILHIDSEAHRFAITFYRKLHGKSVKK